MADKSKPGNDAAQDGTEVDSGKPEDQEVLQDKFLDQEVPEDSTTEGAPPEGDVAEETAEEETLPEPEPEPEPELIAASAPVERVVEKRGGFGAALVGGILAAVLGFFVARSAVIDPYLPEVFRPTDNSGAIAALQAGARSRDAAIADLRGQIAAVPPAPDLTPITSRLDDLSGRLDTLPDELADLSARVGALQAQLGEVESRLTDVEKRPVTEGASPAAVAAYERELAALRESLSAQRAEVDKMIKAAQAKEAEARALKEKADAEAALAETRATLARLRTAVAEGRSYAPMLAEVTAAGLTIPDALAATAEDGVASMAELRDGFPQSARAALSAARDDVGGQGGIIAFLQRQLGVRSVTPRAGNDPDAILSRAEAALTGGDLTAALTELEALPAPAQEAMSGWVAQARARQAAIDAVDALSQSLNTN